MNMNRLGAVLTGEADNPPIKSLYVFGANPATSSPNAGKIVEGLLREDLFTVVHELFMTDTADYADIVLPATSQLEHVDVHKAYGHTVVSYNAPAIPPLAEAKSNWEVMRLLAAAMQFNEPWLHQSAEEVIEEVLTATAAHNSGLQDITLARLKEEHSIPLNLPSPTPFADGKFPTPSGKVQLILPELAEQGLDLLPHWTPISDNAQLPNYLITQSLTLITSAAHHFVSSSFANWPQMLGHEGTPFVEIHPQDAAARHIQNGDQVIVENGRGWCELRAIVTDAVRPGVLVSPKGRWSKLDSGRNVNWTTPDALGDMAGQSTFHSNRVWIRCK